MKVSFVIPSYGHFDLVNQLLVDLHEHCMPAEVIVVEDKSNDQAALDGLQWWAQNYGVNVIVPVENLGFLKASNYGATFAQGDAIVQISTDVRVEDNLTQIVSDLLTQNPFQLIGGVVYEETTGWNEFNGKVFPYAEGWLLGCTKWTWDRLGGFDERYSPNDFEDVDISTMALATGHVLTALNNPKIRHQGAQTIGYTEVRRELTERNRKKFEEKWLS